jgi:hypothetical protein
MALYAETYSSVKNRFLDWMECANAGSNVADIALDRINRAQQELWMLRPWEYLLKRSALTISSREASLPNDFGRIVRVWEDTNGDGMPDRYWYNRSRRTSDGYYLSGSFAKATGTTWKIKFYTAPTATCYVEYIASLTDFTGSSTEYSFFPGDLLLAMAQQIHLEDGGRIDDEYMAAQRKVHEKLAAFEAMAQFQNVDLRMEQNDDGGNRVDNETYSLAEGSNGAETGYDRDYDLRG